MTTPGPAAALPAGIRRAAPRTAGTHFLVAPTADTPGYDAWLVEHECRATCYRVSERPHRITTLCDYGHMVHQVVTGPRSTFAGSAFEASLSDLPAGAPLVLGGHR